MGFAIVRTGGKQYRVTEGDVLEVPQLAADPGDEVEFEVLARGDDASIQIGSPALEGPPVVATVLEHGRGGKIIVFKKKRRKHFKKKHGHRQDFTAVHIDSIGANKAAE